MKNRICYFLTWLSLLLVTFSLVVNAQSLGIVAPPRNPSPVTRLPEADADTESFRVEWIGFMRETQAFLKVLATSETLREKINASGQDLVAEMAAMEAKISLMSTRELISLKAAYPNTKTLHSLVAQLAAARAQLEDSEVIGYVDAAFVTMGKQAAQSKNSKSDKVNGKSSVNVISPDICPALAGVPSITDIAVLAGVVIVARGVMEALPTDFVTILARVAFVVIFTAAEVALVAIQAVYDIHQNCQDDIKTAELIRREVETNLAADPTTTAAIGLFQMPATQGGYLEIARKTLMDIYASQVAVAGPGVIVYNPVNELALGATLTAAGKFREAYYQYRRGYRLVVKYP